MALPGEVKDWSTGVSWASHLATCAIVLSLHEPFIVPVIVGFGVQQMSNSNVL